MQTVVGFNLYYKDILGSMRSNKTNVCSVALESKRDAVADVYKSIQSCMKTHHFTDDEIFGVHLAFEEAFINAVEHGNKGDHTKKVTIKYQIDYEKIDIRVADEGKGFKPQTVPDPREEDNLYKANGRGVWLMKAYMDIVEYNEKGNEVHMVKRHTVD